MSKQLTYKIETLQLLNQLSSISSKLIIKKKDDKIIINRKNDSEQIAFNFEAPIEDFCFGDEEIAFLDFPEFYQLISVFKNPDIAQNENKMVISKEKSKIKYILCDTEALNESPKPLKNIDYDCTFELKQDEIKNISKMIGLINSDNTNLNFSDGKLMITFMNETHENTYEKEFESVSSNGDEFDFIIPSEIFTILPSGDYDAMISKEGLFVLKLKNDRINLKIITSELEDR